MHKYSFDAMTNQGLVFDQLIYMAIVFSLT